MPSKPLPRARGATVVHVRGRCAARQPACLLVRGAMLLRLGVWPDAFGNVIGDSLARSSVSGGAGEKQGVGPWSDYDYRNGSDIQSDNAYVQRQAQPYYDQIVGAFSQGTAASFDRSNDVQLAAGDRFTMDTLSPSDKAPTGANLRGLTNEELAARARAVLDGGSSSGTIAGGRVGSHGTGGRGELSSSAMYAAGYGDIRETVTPINDIGDQWYPEGPSGGTVVSSPSSPNAAEAAVSNAWQPAPVSAWDAFSQGWRGNGWSVLEHGSQPKPFAYGLGGGTRAVVDSLTGAGAINQARQAFANGQTTRAVIYGMQGVGEAGLTAMSLGTYALAKSALTVGAVGVRGRALANGVDAPLDKIIRPGGYIVNDIDAHGVLSSQANRAKGYTNTRADNYVQSHHPIQDKWAQENVLGYNRDAAPAILLESSSGSAHAQISAAQRSYRGTLRNAGLDPWATSISSEFDVGYRQMLQSGVPEDAARKAIRESYKYFDALGAFK